MAPIKSAVLILVPVVLISAMTFPAGWSDTRSAANQGGVEESRIADLPLIEIPAKSHARNDFAVVLSGDGGWAGIDRKIGELLAEEQGVPVVGLNTLKYFLTRRTPDETARDVERIVRHYSRVWEKSRVMLIGYSFGADVLPFVVNRLPEDLRASIELVVFISLGSSIDFKFTLSDWLGGKPKPTELPTMPEMIKLRGMKILCVYGKEDKDPACANAEIGFVTAVPLEGGHGIHGDASDVVAAAMQALR